MITLAELVDAGEAQVRLEKYIKQHEEKLIQLKEEHRKLSQETLPNMMAEIGLMSFKLADGSEIGIADMYYAKIPEDNYAAFQWLRENDMDGIIKTQVTLNFGKGEDEELQKIEKLLQEAGVMPVVKSTVHHSTLKAFVKEQLTKGAPIPLDAFGAGSFRASVVKK